MRRKGRTKDLTRCWEAKHEAMTLSIIFGFIMIEMIEMTANKENDDGIDDDDDNAAPPVLVAKEVLHPLLPAWPGPRRLGAGNRF